MPIIPLPTRLSPLDLALVAIYLVAITLFGLQFREKKGTTKSLKNYFLADNTIPWWAIALSIVSAETSTLTIISIPGVAYAGDLGFLQVVLGYMLGRIVVAILFLPRYFRGEMLTAYQLIGHRFGPRLHKLTAGLFLLTRAAAEGVRVFAISIVVGIAIGTGDTLSIAIISALTLLYTFEGGMAAVIWTDVVQMGLYVAGTLIALWTLGTHAGGWAHIHAVAAPIGKFHWLDFSFTLAKSYTFWAGILGGTFLTMASHGTDQLMVQRLLAARNLRESRLALLSSGAVIFLQFTLFLLIGVGLYVFYSEHPQAFSAGALSPQPDRIFPTFIVQQMPHGVAGLLVAAILAAAMSNLSAALNSLASTTVIDFWIPFQNRVPHHHRSEAKVIVGGIPAKPDNTTKISRLATVFWALVLFAIAVYSIKAGQHAHVVEIALSIASVAYGSLLGVFLLGTLTKYATQTGTILGMLAGFLTNLILWQFPPTGLTLLDHHLTMPKIAFTWYVLIGSAVTFAIGTLFSLILPKPRLRQATATLLLLALTFSATAQILPPPQHPTAFLLSFRSEAKEPAVAASPHPTTFLLSFRSEAKESAFSTPPYDFTPITNLLNDSIAAKKLPGAVVVIGHNGKIVFHHAYGNRKSAGEPGPNGLPTPAEPMTEDTIFDMASLTKVMVTTVAILQLWEQGKLDLDAPVSKYLPEFTTTTGAPNPPPPPLPQAQRPDSDQPGAQAPATPQSPPQPPGAPSMAQPHRDTGGMPDIAQATTWKSRITIRQLLTHYSGLPEDISLKDPWGLVHPDKAEGIRRALAAIPYGPPGLTFKYSDINFITLGVLVEFITGQPLQQYAQEKILSPLSMHRSGFNAFCNCQYGYFPAYGRGTLDVGKLMNSELPHDCTNNVCVEPDVTATAPTAHDDQLTPALNPNYDHLLRGTVHDPTTRRMGGVAGHAGLFSTASDAARFCEALLAKMNHNTGPFPLQQATLQSALRPQAPTTAVSNATIFTQDQATTKGVAQRALGWDLNSAFSRPRGEIFPITTSAAASRPAHPGSFGHTGFTGTSLWLDPVSDTYVILLANAIHPRGNPPISALRGQVATAAARALGLTAQATTTNILPVPPAFLLSSRSAVEGPASRTSNTPGAPSFEPHPKGGVSSNARPPSPTPKKIVILSEGPRSLTARDAVEGPAFRLASTTAPSLQPQTLTGIDVLEQTHYAPLLKLAAKHQNHLRIALLTNQSGVDSENQRTIDLLLHADPHIELLKLFTPEHGLLGKQDTEHLKAEEDPTTHLPVISLYGAKPSNRHPRQSDLKDLDAVVIDLQDAGVRFWTYTSVLGYFLEAAAKAHIEVVVLDRPNPIAGIAVQGPISDPGTEFYANFMPTPVRHGMTFGELARFYNANAKQVDLDPALLDARAITLGTPTTDDKPPATQPGLHASLTVVPMQNWHRDEYWQDTGLTWIPPSPNLRTPRAAILYPAIGLIETTNLSVGRGTQTPFENIGAPFLNAIELAAYLNTRHIPGIEITPTTLTIAETPERYPSHGQTIPGLHFEVTEPTHFDSPEFGIELLAALHHLYPKDFQLDKAKTLLCNADTLAALKANTDPRDIAQTWQLSLKLFVAKRAQALLY